MKNKLGQKASIVLVNWNGWNDTIKCIESLVGLDYINYEIVIVDNLSDDDSVDKIRKWCEENPSINYHEVFPESMLTNRNAVQSAVVKSKISVTLIKNHANLGYAGGNNIGIKYSFNFGAEYVWLLNNDTTVKSDSLTKLIGRAIIEDGNILLSSHILFAGNINQSWFAGGIYSPYSATAYRVNYSKFLQSKFQFLTGCALFITRKVFDSIGYLNDAIFLYAEDVDFSIKAKRSGIKLDIEFESKVFHSVSSSSKKIGGRAYFLHIRNMIWVMRRNHGDLFLFSIIPFHVIKLLGLVTFRGKPVSTVKYYLLGMMRGSIDSLK